MPTRSDATTGRRGVRLDGAVALGLALVVLGVLLTLDNLEVVDAGALLAGWWPAVVIAAGVWWAVVDAPIAGLVLALVGGFLLVATQDVVDVELGRLVLPGVLVVLGGASLQAGAQVRAARVDGPPDAAGGDPTQQEGPSATAIFGDAHLVVADDGGAAARVVVTATSVFGDVRVDVPAGWRIEERITRLLGNVALPHDAPGDPGATVVSLQGLVLFGDVKVRRGQPARGGR